MLEAMIQTQELFTIPNKKDYMEYMWKKLENFGFAYDKRVFMEYDNDKSCYIFRQED